MNRRHFLKTTSVVAASVLLPRTASAAPIDFNRVQFDADRYAANNAQTIMIFLYGGASELGGNLTNIDAIKAASQSNYDNYFRGITPTENGFWQEAGGTIMERMLANEDMNIFRTCYSQLRDDEGNRSHGRCVSQNQRGLNDDNDTAGIFAAIANTLYQKGAIDTNTKLPFLTMEGESIFFSAPDFTIESFLKPTALTSSLSNPYRRSGQSTQYYYTASEREVEGYQENRSAFDIAMDTTAQGQNIDGKIKESFDKRAELDTFITAMQETETPEGITYPDNNSFADKLETAVKIVVNNPDTKVISLGGGGLGGWDDHNEARDYTSRMERLMSAIESAVAHLKAEGKEGSVNIMVMGDFGRNVNLNSALGWDHGNQQNVYMFCGKNYFNPVGVVGETKLTETGTINRMYLKPQDGAYWFEPYSVAATLYSIYGITNPSYLTGGFGPIEAGLLS